jgi:hypothetical protein
MMCNVSYVVCRYSMLNGLIVSKEVRRTKEVGSSQSSGAASRQSSRQGAVEDVRLQEVIAQRDAYFKNGSPHSKSKCHSTTSIADAGNFE